ncbi:MAG: chorismate mutase [Acholeplasmatales bacterium]|nr:chorismate mutase [Acholeplasmatales bacterium]
MKTKLEVAREMINDIDKEMVELFKKRMEAVRMVALHKLENNMAVLDSSREASIKEKNLNLLNDEELESYYLTFFEGVLTSSKDFQKVLIKNYEELKK